MTLIQVENAHINNFSSKHHIPLYLTSQYFSIISPDILYTELQMFLMRQNTFQNRFPFMDSIKKHTEKIENPIRLGTLCFQYVLITPKQNTKLPT